MISIFKKKLSLTKKGEELIRHYKKMVDYGYHRSDGIHVKNTYEDFELNNFKDHLAPHFESFNIKSVLDYGGGGSNWEKNGFVPKELWLKAGEIGILCPNVPKKYGGIEGDFR